MVYDAVVKIEVLMNASVLRILVVAVCTEWLHRCPAFSYTAFNLQMKSRETHRGVKCADSKNNRKVLFSSAFIASNS